jgi:hypothetical protein
MLTPVKGQQQTQNVKEGLIQHVEFPLLFESSSFLTAPIISDVNKDGIPDVILTDYDGGVYAMGLQVKEGKRWMHRTQVPRLFIRRKWMESFVNETLGIEAVVSEDTKEEDPDSSAPPKDRYHHSGDKPNDPYHSHFEYVYGEPDSHENVMRGISANIMGQDHEQIQALEDRRKRQSLHNFEGVSDEVFKAVQGEDLDSSHRRLQEADPVAGEAEDPERLSTAEQIEKDIWEDRPANMEIPHLPEKEIPLVEDDMTGDIPYDDFPPGFDGDEDAYPDYYGEGDDYKMDYYDGDDVPRTYDANGEGDDYTRYVGYDDYYGRYYQSDHDDYYDDKHYVRLSPHILSTPTLMELPKLYANDESEHYLFIAVSYYLDEDEFDGIMSYKRFSETDTGHETEVQRGMYVASALVVYTLSDSSYRWGRQEHLDLSGDHSSPVNTTLVGSIPLRSENTKMGAFALSSPAVADIDGNGEMEVLVGTSMGILYCMDARNLFKKDGWPIQLQHAIESRILVEDVQGDTNLEIFALDVGGNIVCLSHDGRKIWHRELLAIRIGGEILGQSSMVLGDVDGDGVLDVVVVMKIRTEGGAIAHYLFAVSADKGRDVTSFPLQINQVDGDAKGKKVGEEFVVEKLPAPLLVDLHSDQEFLLDYIRRNGTKWYKERRRESGSPAPHGGLSSGLHIVLPVGSDLVIAEAGSGCIQSISIGDDILAMVQADDVHGTNSLDLVITTASGNTVTLESQSPYHPLNVWNNGETRGRANNAAHGYSASQGVFVHDVSRKFRDIFGVYIPITFEIFDNRPNIMNEPDKRVYKVEVREGLSKARLKKAYNSTGVYTERIYIPSGPGYYALTVVLKTTHGLIYEDTFHIGYNINYMEGFGILLWLPLVIACIVIFVLGTKPGTHWEDDDFQGDLLGGTLPE